MPPTVPAPPAPAPRPSPAFRITYPPSLSAFNVPPSAYIEAHYPPSTYAGLATAALVFSPSDRILLLRRAQHDSMPGLWEPPGGAADEEDGSLFVSAARELWEEAGLQATRIVRVASEGEGIAPGSRITNRTGTVAFVRFGFEVVVEGAGTPEVRIDPNEHDAFVWATEGEVRNGSVETIEGEFGMTYGGTKDVVLDAFRRRRVEAPEEATASVGKEAAVVS